MAIDWSRLVPQIIALIMLIVAAFLMQEHYLFPNKREFLLHRRRYIGFAIFVFSIFIFLYGSSQDLPIVFAAWSVFLLAFATFISVEQSQRMMQETRRDVVLVMVRDWANDSLRNLSTWEGDTLLRTLKKIEADGFTAVASARGIGGMVESSVRAAIACCVTLRVWIEQTSGLPAGVGPRVDQLKQELMNVINSASQTPV